MFQEDEIRSDIEDTIRLSGLHPAIKKTIMVDGITVRYTDYDRAEVRLTVTGGAWVQKFVYDISTPRFQQYVLAEFWVRILPGDVLDEYGSALLILEEDGMQPRFGNVVADSIIGHFVGAVVDSTAGF